jgi:hypothetical protein
MNKTLAALLGISAVFLFGFGVGFLKGDGDASKLAHNVADNGSIDADKIDPDIAAIYSSDIADQSIRSIDLAANSVGRSEIKTNAVRGAEIIAGAVRASEIAAGAVRISEIATGAVGAYEILDGHVRSAEIATGAVHNSELAANAVTSDKILDGTITFADIDSIDMSSEITAVGSGALDANTDGARNVAFGYGALGANTSADDNVGIGHSALALVDATGNRNTAVGNYALDAVTNGVWNVGVGYGALGNGPAIDGSTAVGYLALSLATGDNNIGIGYQAGNSITSGGSNIVIGYDADVPTGGATLSNQLNIGGAIWGDLSNGYIGIGDFSAVGVPGDAMLSIIQLGTVPHIELNPIAEPSTDVSEGDIYMNTNGILYIRSNSAWAAANTAADFSELIVPVGFNKETHDGVVSYVGNIEAGDLIVINKNGYYERSTRSYDPLVVGVESGDRGRFWLKAGSLEREEGQRQVAIMGHILVNVSAENGPIRPGDSLTTSSLPGHAMKATEPGSIVGKALKSFDGSQGATGMIEALVNPGWFGGIR